MSYNKLKESNIQVDFCIIGGGISGICAAISAARNGAKVALIHDRPVLGGNASSEIRMWICGAQGNNNRETGIVEEIELANLYRNNSSNFSIWDSILYEKVAFEPNIKLIMNCSCNKVKMNGDTIESVTAWQLTTETWHTVSANYFADCSGDGILAPLTGAQFRLGRESSDEFNESIAPKEADDKTMGMSCLIQFKECTTPQKFIPPEWAYKYPDDSSLLNRPHTLERLQNFWWLEVGGTEDTIHDTEELKHELQKIAYGIWDHIKNYGDHGAKNWTIEWIGSLPGKRESRRFIGDHILTQNDIESEGKFDDLVAYGGWSMDDHHPDGLYYPGEPTIFHKAPSPYGIPYRCLYSKNIDNMFFAGRNISCTHSAMSSTRVMATCGTMGQAIGTAAAICAKENIKPRDIYYLKIDELQQSLMDQDCYLPWHKREICELSKNAQLTASCENPELLRNGIDRPIGKEGNSCLIATGDWIQYTFDKIEQINIIRIVFDSDLNRNIKNMPSNYPISSCDKYQTPKTIVKKYDIKYLDKNGDWVLIYKNDNNYQRFLKIAVNIEARAIKLIIKEIDKLDKTNLFALEVL